MSVLNDPTLLRQPLTTASIPSLTSSSGSSGSSTSVTPVLPSGMGFNWPNTVVQYVNHWDQQSTPYVNRARPFQVAAERNVKLMRTFFGTVDSINGVFSTDGPTRTAAWAGLQEILDTAWANGVQLILANYLDQNCIQALAGTTYASWADAQTALTTQGSVAWNGYQSWMSQALGKFANHPAVFSWEVVNEPNYMLGIDAGTITVDLGCTFLDTMATYLRTNGAKKINGGGRVLYTKSSLTDAQVVLSTRGLDYLDDHFYPTEGTASVVLTAMDTHVARVKTLLGHSVPVILGEFGSSEAVDPNFFTQIYTGAIQRGWYPLTWGYDAFDANEFNESTETYVLDALDAQNGGHRANALRANIFYPADHGFVTWNYDPANASTSSAPTVGAVHLLKVKLTEGALITGVALQVTAAGTSLANCFIGLYDSGGNRVALSADRSTEWAASGFYKDPFTATYSAPVGTYYVAILVGAGSAITFARNSTANVVNAGLTAAGGFRACTSGTGQTALPATITLSGTTASSPPCYWVALY